MTQQGLFDPPVRGHRPTRSDAVKNRRAGYEHGKQSASGFHDTMRFLYAARGPLTDVEMAELLSQSYERRIERSTVNARRNEMADVEEKGSRKNHWSGKNNTLYGLIA